MSESKPLNVSNASQNLAVGSLTHTFTMPAYTDNIEILEVLLRSSIAISQTVTVTRVSATGANYSFVYDTSALSAATNYVYLPTRGRKMKRGDTLTVTCTNTATPAATVYSEIIYREDI